jgi:HIRAN domain
MRLNEPSPEPDPTPSAARDLQGPLPDLPTEFICTVHGVCFENRYRKLGGLAKGDPLYLQREHGSRIDANAIRVMDPRVEQLGYLPPEISRWLAPLIDRGSPTLARVHRVSRKDIPYYERLVIEVEVR